MYSIVYLHYFSKKVHECFGGLRNCCTFAPANEKTRPRRGVASNSGAQFFDMIP